MQNYSGAYTGWHKLQAYAESYPEYKIQARKLISESLGFEPPIHISMHSEITLRYHLSRMNSGEVTKEFLMDQIAAQTKLTRKLIRKYAPGFTNHL